MARDTSNALTTPAFDAVQKTVFSPKQWAELAQMLVGQDLVVLPVGTAALGHEKGDTGAEVAHRKASALALAQHWASLGFVLSKQDTLALCAHDTTAHAWLHTHITSKLLERVGGHVRMKPMYPNFPKQVMDMDEAELLFNAVLHYMGDEMDMRLLPDTQEKDRKRLPKKDAKARVLRVVDMAGVKQALIDLAQMNTVWTPGQVELAKHALPLMLHWGVAGENTSLPQRENQAHLVGMWLSMIKQGTVEGEAWPADRVSTTDILRAMVAYSGGDASLASTSPKARFVALSRKQRKIVMRALERAVMETHNPLVDLHTKRQSWLRLAEVLHVGEWKNMPKAREAIHALRNQAAPVSWNGQLDALLEQAPDAGVVGRVVAMFPANPGLAARSLHRVLMWAGDQAGLVIDAFSAVAERVDTPVLLTVEATMTAEKSGRARVMLPKGAAAWRYRVPGKRAALDGQVARDAAAACEQALLARFGALAPIGKVFVEEGLDQVIVPKGLRSASESVGVVSRGSWLPVDGNAKIVRLFLWWKDTDEGRVDVDLSAVGVDEKFQNTETCNFHALKEAGMTHSGDLTSAPNGAAEFIDIRLDKLNPKTRYVVLSANVYHGPGFSRLPECFVGWQERSSGKGQRGQIMEVKSVAEKFAVTCQAKGFLGAVFDVRERRLMWLDLPLQTRSYQSIHGSSGDVRAAVEDFQLYAASQPKVGRLIDLHVKARGGEVVDQMEEADVVFSLTSKLAAEGQTVIAATQPQTVASALLAGPVRDPGAKAKAQCVTHQENELNMSIQAKARVATGPKR